MARKRTLLVTLFLLSLWLPLQACSSNWGSPYKAAKVFETDGVIWGFDFLSPNELIITLRHGEFLYVNLKDEREQKLNLSAVAAKGQGGLLDVHYRPLDGKDYLYFTFSTDHQGQLTTALARGLWENNSLTQIETLFAAKVRGDSGRHFGSRLLFQDDYIFMTVGDRGERNYAQDLSYHNGKVLRLDLNGKAAKGNPFMETAGALPEIWSYGHRNPQGIDLDPSTGDIYSCEFGPRGGDELNLIKPSVNYGWPEITYGREYSGPKIGTTHHPDMEQPLVYWVPSLSPSGMAFYQGDKIPEWENSLFLAGLGTGQLRRLVLEQQTVSQQEILFEGFGERIRHVRNGPDGYLYFSTDSGYLYRVFKKS